MKPIKSIHKHILLTGILFFISVGFYWRKNTSFSETEQLFYSIEKTNFKNKLSKQDRIELAFQQEFVKTFDPNLGLIPRDRLSIGHQVVQNKMAALKQARKAVTLTWSERGPNNVGGRTKSIMWDQMTQTTPKLGLVQRVAVCGIMRM